MSAVIGIWELIVDNVQGLRKSIKAVFRQLKEDAPSVQEVRVSKLAMILTARTNSKHWSIWTGQHLVLSSKRPELGIDSICSFIHIHCCHPSIFALARTLIQLHHNLSLDCSNLNKLLDRILDHIVFRVVYRKPSSLISQASPQRKHNSHLIPSSFSALLPSNLKQPFSEGVSSGLPTGI